MKRTLILLLCLVLCTSFILSSCNDSSDEDLFATPSGSSTSAKTTQTSATTSEPSGTQMPTNLTPEIENENEIVSRLVAGTTGMTVEIYNGETIELTYHGWPTVCKGEGSTLYATASLRMSHVDPFGLVVFYESNDNGLTWSDPVVVADTPLDDRDSGVLYLGNGRIIVNWFAHNASNYFAEDDDGTYTGWQKSVTKAQMVAVKAKWDAQEKADPQWLLGGSFTSISTDGGKTWSEPSRVAVKSPHGMTLGQDGRTLYFFGALAANWNLSGTSGLTSGNYFYLLQSKNYGQTWSKVGAVTLPNNIAAAGKSTLYDEGYCIQLQDGSFLAGFRTQNTIYGSWTVLISKSEDGGKTWTEPFAIKDADGTYLSGSPPHFLQLKSGVIILAYTHREVGDKNDRKCGSRFRLSYDNGLTWTEEFILCVSDQPLQGDLGYPTTVELDDGTLLTTYYQAYGTDKYPSLLYTRWRLVEADSDAE